MSPLLGLHTVLGVALASVFRLNRLVTLVGVYVTNPWTIVPIYTFSTWVGARLLGINDVIPDIDWGSLSLKALANEFGHLIMPFVIGTTLVGLVSSVIGYFIVLRATRRNHG